MFDFSAPSRTLSLALSVLPLLSRAFDMDKLDDWIFDKLPEWVKKDATLQEFDAVISTGKSFLSACHAFFH